MIGGLLRVSGLLILLIVYGKKKVIEHRSLMAELSLSFANIMWLMCFAFWIGGIASNDTVFCAIVTIGYPIAIVIWTVIARIKQKNKKEIDNISQDEHQNSTEDNDSLS